MRVKETRSLEYPRHKDCKSTRFGTGRRALFLVLQGGRYVASGYDEGNLEAALIILRNPQLRRRYPELEVWAQATLERLAS